MEKILYLITDNTLEREILIERTTAAISAGIDMLQYRGKKVSEAQGDTNLMDQKTASLVMALKKMCHEGNIPLIINDDPYLAKAVGADGVHLGQEDMGPDEARAILGPKSIIGVTAKTAYQAVKAASEGANYLGVGAIYPSKTKENALGITLETLKAIKASVTIPVYGIGGLHPDNLTSEILENTDGLCFVSAVYRAENIRETIQEIRDVMKQENQKNKRTSESEDIRMLKKEQYATQMAAAKAGIITEAMNIVAKKENRDPEYIRACIAKGTVVIPANIHHTCLDPAAVGEGLSTKINVNLGISKDCYDIPLEMRKVREALRLGAHSIMDLSNYGDTEAFRKSCISEATCMIGTVPMYDAIGFYDRELKDITAKEFLDVVRKHGEDGVDFVTIHAGINQKSAQRFLRNKRLANIVSRGGSLLFAWMQLTGHENPFYEYYDELLEICREYDITLSLGDALRPGAIYDATDASQIEELITLGELTKRAWERDVQVIIEGPGHMAMDEIETNVILQKRLCHGAPFYVLGPLVTDVAPGYDHITGAIGGAIAAAAGADFLCYVTPAEHLRLPTLEDMKEGIMASKIAAHAGDLAKKVPGSRKWDNEMSLARVGLDWPAMFALAMDEEKARAYREHAKLEDESTCSMCGKMCAVRNVNKVLNGEDILIK